MSKPATLSENQVQKILSAAKVASAEGQLDGSLVKITYLASGKPTERAIREAAPVKDRGGDLHEYVGHLNKVFTAKDGSYCFNLFVFNRVDETNPGSAGAYRTFNPRKGQLLNLQVLS